jgi:hypothetical protein
MRTLFIGLTLTLAAAGAHAQPADVVAREIARVRAGAAAVPSAQREGFDARLARADQAAGAGRLLLSLFELQGVWEMQHAYAFAAGAGVTSAAEFEKRWTEIGPPAPRPAANAADRALFLEALAQSSEGKALATYNASLPYSQDAGLDAGLYYLGESQAFTRFAAMTRNLEIAPPGPPPALRSLAPELDALETEVLNAYDTAEGDARTPFIGISVTLKLARQLDVQQRLPGALLQYLLARYRFALARTPGDPGDDVPARLTSADTFDRAIDHSIAWFFLELARTHASSRAGAGLRNAAAILDDVLPAYRAAIR